uniref:RNA-binding S4 domain-containing protein n=1 Tax=Peronospora matthiolae TaxID=2874970 RepID=A0AAV1VNH8_9STRA
MTLGQRLQVTRRSLVTLHKSTRSPATSKRRQDAVAAPAAASAVVAQDTDEAPSPIRLAKRIAMSGLCSRRAAEKRIRSADVTVNGRVVDDVATVVDVARDVVAVDGRALAKTQQRTMWMAHKMKGELVTDGDPQGRATIFDRLRVMGLVQHMMPVGRLDFNTEGLLLLTNDGDHARELEHPKTGVVRVYRALVRGNVAESKLQELQRGPIVDGVKYRPMNVTVQSTDKKDSWLQVTVTEGKNREVRKALAHVRLVVKRLIRVQYGPYRLADLPLGAVLKVRTKSFEKKSSGASEKQPKIGQTLD